MKFIDQSTSPMNVLTDGQFVCAYMDIPKVFEEIQEFLVKKEISTQDCLTLECDNSVANALTLLYLLEGGYSFLLLPKEGKVPQGTGSKPFFPGFCHYKIEIKSIDNKKAYLNNSGKPASLDPEQFLSITENGKWIGKRNIANQKLYLRTSGSTGFPKMAMHSHANLRNNVLNCVRRLHLGSSHRIAIPVPISHLYGLGAAFLPGVAVGASIDLQKGANILRYMQREQEFNPNTAFMTPVFCETLLKGRKSPRPYKLTVIGGDRIRGNTFEKYESLFGRVVQVYGSTEMGAIAAASPDMPANFRAETVGKPMENVQIHLGEERSEHATKKADELWCHHQYGFEGYVDENGESVDLGQEYQDGWFRTKDFGRIRPEGCLEVLGRYDHSVNRDGLLVLFSDVEKTIETIEGVEVAVVISKGESERGKGLLVYCVLAKGVDITEKDIRTACFDLLSRNAIPDQIIIAHSLPLLANGKIDRRKLMDNGIAQG
uniref:AMP-binding enzyme C-terminal domain-containing protein n=1 Tax=Candidatus Kentrum eta TaxID=2126337 RepID=A0A450V2L6_9GAMM|nr:MAG: AMP-binding enzyme C-terminal domain-containing protein [Candidatus Kentron sp. H]VFJ92340.1 MAG: AMP-binding enzyme C-terminal domain-containing protein [Candidatus Kentron sp. H]VFJ98936.1 MAG: AMP-binding enzyme C-terminal domain-containing protein [Candidatus Kentron sp. H]